MKTRLNDSGSENTCNVNVPTRHARGLSRRELSNAVITRFYTKYNISKGCWLWRAGKFRTGYGMVNLGRNAKGQQHTEYAHRVAYVLTYGAIPAGAVVMHSCDVTSCVNPLHLKLGTQGENVADGVRKGRYANNGAHRRRKDAA